jgi:hypothetical protein
MVSITFSNLYETKFNNLTFFIIKAFSINFTIGEFDQSDEVNPLSITVSNDSNFDFLKTST